MAKFSNKTFLLVSIKTLLVLLLLGDLLIPVVQAGKSSFKSPKSKKKKKKQNISFFENKLEWCHKLIGNSINETVGAPFILQKASNQNKMPLSHPF